MIRFECPHCGKGLRTANSLAGEAFTCPECRGRVRVPKVGDSRAPVRSPALASRFAVEPYQPPPFWSSGRVVRAIAAGVFAGIAIGLLSGGPAFVLLIPSWLSWWLFVPSALAAAFSVFSVCAAGRHPVCSRCCRWKSIRDLGSIERDGPSAKEALEAGDLAALGALSPEGDRIEVSVAHCQKCGREAPMDVRFVVRAAGKEQTSTAVELAHVSYPGAALPTFERLCADRNG